MPFKSDKQRKAVMAKFRVGNPVLVHSNDAWFEVTRVRKAQSGKYRYAVESGFEFGEDELEKIEDTER